jgi:hypothetical protein
MGRARIAGFRELAEPAGWQVAVEGSQLTLSRLPAPQGAR